MSIYPTPAPEPIGTDSNPSSSARWVRRVFRWQNLDSTNEAAFRALDQGVARDGDAFVASGQTQGRGRRGSQWCSEPGQGLYVSFSMLPGRPLNGPMVTISAGLATKSALASLGLSTSHLKWPNDLLVGPNKLAGILVESRAWSAESPIYVLGVGINVSQFGFPEDLTSERPVISLAQCGVTATLQEVEQALFACLGTRFEQARMAPRALGRDYLEALGFGTSPVSVQVASETVTGSIASLDFERGLEISTIEGHKRWVPLEHIRSVTASEPRQG
jgi:biotin-[acetyl-CoA-carboxylase] ligase BirA-like protein